MTDWHLQAFGEWLTCLFPREAVGHCVGQREWPLCCFFDCLLSINALLVCLLFCSVCSDVLHTVLDHGIEAWHMYIDFRRVVISGQCGT